MIPIENHDYEAHSTSERARRRWILSLLADGQGLDGECFPVSSIKHKELAAAAAAHDDSLARRKESMRLCCIRCQGALTSVSAFKSHSGII
jgi:hypothetical protein